MLLTQQPNEVEISDKDFENLVDDQRIGQYKKQAEQYTRGISKEQYYMLRARCKRDLFFLTNGVLGYTRLVERLHGHLCKDVEDTEDTRFRLYLMPRFHFKSTILTISHNIQVTLPYGELERQHDEFASKPISWPNILGPNVRIMIGHETAKMASRFLFSITQHFTSNPMFMGLFPELVPNRKQQRVNQQELELPRTKYWAEPTIDTMGVGEKGQGRHYNLINLDDIFGDKARDSAAEKETTNQWFDNVPAFFDQFNRDHLLLAGTRYDWDDTYGHAMDVYKEQLHVYRRSVIENPNKIGEYDPKGVPIFREEITVESLDLVKHNPKVWIQFTNIPIQVGVGFKQEWKRYFQWKSRNLIEFFETPESKYPTIINVRDCWISILIDFGGGTSGGFVVTATDHTNRNFCLVAIPVALQPPDMVTLIFSSVARWQPGIVSMESDMFQNTYQFWMKSEMQKRGVYFNIYPYETKKRAKEARIQGLSNYYDAYQIFYNETQKQLIWEHDNFGKVRQGIHILDALAQGPEVWRKGNYPGWHKQQLQQEQFTPDLSDRDTQTGYSLI